jgi:hypothetical protein
MDPERNLVGHKMTPQPFDMEAAQRARMIELNQIPADGRAAAEALYGEVWDQADLRRDFEVLAFQAPWVVVKRRADGVVGSLEFQHTPRYYFGFREDKGQDSERNDR